MAAAVTARTVRVVIVVFDGPRILVVNVETCSCVVAYLKITFSSGIHVACSLFTHQAPALDLYSTKKHENSSTLCNKGGDGFQVEKRKVKTKLTASVNFLAALVCRLCY
ncbi:hypothetical protein HN873_065088, partial [Arachis hypogaea]